MRTGDRIHADKRTQTRTTRARGARRRSAAPSRVRLRPQEQLLRGQAAHARHVPRRAAVPRTNGGGCSTARFTAGASSTATASRRRRAASATPEGRAARLEIRTGLALDQCGRELLQVGTAAVSIDDLILLDDKGAQADLEDAAVARRRTAHRMAGAAADVLADQRPLRRADTGSGHGSTTPATASATSGITCARPCVSRCAGLTATSAAPKCDCDLWCELRRRRLLRRDG